MKSSKLKNYLSLRVLSNSCMGDLHETQYVGADQRVNMALNMKIYIYIIITNQIEGKEGGRRILPLDAKISTCILSMIIGKLSFNSKPFLNFLSQWEGQNRNMAKCAPLSL